MERTQTVTTGETNPTAIVKQVSLEMGIGANPLVCYGCLEVSCSLSLYYKARVGVVQW